ncbi:transposase [Candidatus Parcubacteria bacterium]|nr:transposase [Candidatus Parcubacteria bacterium]
MLKSMQRWGKTPKGKIRWRCKYCATSATRKRKDNCEQARLSLFIKWLTSKDSLVDVAHDVGVSVQSIIKRFEPFWLTPPQPQITTNVRVLVLDGTSVVKRKLMLLIAGDGDQHIPIFWSDVHRECFDTWGTFLRYLLMCHIQPEYIVCDGQKGLLKAIREVYPDTKIQRCVIHIIRQSNRWLTKNPKTRAGRELLVLVKQLSQIQTKRQKRRWIRSFRYWCGRHDKFLKERSYGPTGRWWYTHRRLRATRSLIKNAIPDLFRHVSDPTVPKTSNHVEGGLNARL